MTYNATQWTWSAFSSIFSRRPAPPTTYTSPHTGQTFYYGKCYDAAGNMIEEAVDSMPLIGEIMLFAPLVHKSTKTLFIEAYAASAVTADFN